MMCVEIGPVVEACLYNRCAYCKTVFYEPLTKEHVIPKALDGTWSPKLVCRSCNQQRGADMDFEPFVDMVHRFPVLLDCAKQTHISEWRWKNRSLSFAMQTVIGIILTKAQNHKNAVALIVTFTAATREGKL